MNGQNIQTIERHINDCLQLLHRCGWRANGWALPSGLRKTVKWRESQYDADFQFHPLDTLASCLTNGNGVVVATAIDQREPPHKVVLARTPAPLSSDRSAASHLCALLVDPRTETYKDIFPFIHSYCLPTLQRRIQKVHALLDATDFAPPSTYQSTAVEQEFPLHELIPAYTRATIDATDVLSVYYDILTTLKQACHIGSQMDPAGPDTALQIMDQIFPLAQVLHQSRFLKELSGDVFSQGVGRKLCRRLRRLLEYGPGLTELIQYIQARFPPTEDSLDVWVDSPSPVAVSNQGWVAALQEVSHGLRSEICQPNPPLSTSWSSTYHPSVHPELQVVAYFQPESLFWEHRHHHPCDKFEPVLIGMSGPSCLTCQQWLDRYNEYNDAQWCPSSFSSKPSVNWAMPVYPSTDVHRPGACLITHGEFVKRIEAYVIFGLMGSASTSPTPPRL